VKKVLVYIIALMLLTVVPLEQPACAEAMPLSSDSFVSASISLSTSGIASFSATVRRPCTISVSRCTLQKKENGRWVYAASLTPPPNEENSMTYSADKDYSTNMTKGVTYRIVTTFKADGESVTKTSNSFTY